MFWLCVAWWCMDSLLSVCLKWCLIFQSSCLFLRVGAQYSKLGFCGPCELYGRDGRVAGSTVLLTVFTVDRFPCCLALDCPYACLLLGFVNRL